MHLLVYMKDLLEYSQKNAIQHSFVVISQRRHEKLAINTMLLVGVKYLACFFL